MIDNKIIIFSLIFAFAVQSVATAGTKDIYKFKWMDKDASVYVLQNKVFEKDGSSYINFNYGSNDLSAFQESSAMNLQIGFFFSEDWGLELFFSSYSNFDNDAYQAISKTTDFVPFVRKLDNAYGAYLLYSPFYGKINTFNQIFYLDWTFGVGGASLNLQDNRDSFLDLAKSDKFVAESGGGIAFKTAWRVYLSRHWHVLADYSRIYFSALRPIEKKETKLYYSADMVFGLGYNF